MLIQSYAIGLTSDISIDFAFNPHLTDLTGKAIFSSNILKGKIYFATMQNHHNKQIGKHFPRLRIFLRLSSTM